MTNKIHNKYVWFCIVIALVMILPILGVLHSALGLEGSMWDKLWQNRLPFLLTNSLSLVLTVTIGSLILGGALAWLVERTDLPGQGWIKPLLVAPLIIPCYITTICYIGFFGVRGLLEKILIPIWPDVEVFNIYGFWGAAGMLTLGTYPYVYAIVGASLRRLDPTLSEAAKCLGAGRLKRFFQVTLPILTPALTAGAALSALYVLSDFGVVSLLRYQTFVSAIYEQMSGRYDYSVASALSVVLILFTLTFLVIQENLGGKRRYFTGHPRTGQYPITHLRALKYPAFLLIIVIISLGLMVPIGVLVYWVVQSLKATEATRIWSIPVWDLLQSGWNSLSVSVIAATVAIIFSLPLAYWSIRHPKSRFGKVLAWSSQSGIALPGVLIALGVSLIFLHTLPILNFSVIAIILAFLIHFFAQGFQSVRSGLAQVSMNLEESARLLGCTPIQTFWLVTRPLLKGSLWAGWILVFLSCLRELPAALLLRPAGFDTLTVKVWITASEGFYAQAAQPALMLVFLSLPLLFIVLQGQGDRYEYN